VEAAHGHCCLSWRSELAGMGLPSVGERSCDCKGVLVMFIVKVARFVACQKSLRGSEKKLNLASENGCVE